MTPLARNQILAQLSEQDDLCLNLLKRIVDQVLACNDPDIVETFIAWRNEPRIDSILDLAASLDDEHLDQLLFAAEDLYSATQHLRPRVRA